MAAHASIRVALVGCGVIGRTHAEVLTRLPGYELVMSIDGDLDAADTVSDLVESLGARRPTTASSLGTALSGDVTFDMVTVATPSGLHADVALEAFAADKHVMIEKPLDVDFARARVLAEASEEARGRGLFGSVISQHRFDPSTVAVANALRSGRFGKLGSALISVPWWRSDDYYSSASWRGTWALDGGGALMNQGVHSLDLLIALLGRPLRANAEFGRFAHENIEVEDTLVGTLTFASGALAAVHATTAGYPGFGARLQLHGSTGSAVIEDDELKKLHLADLEHVGELQEADHSAQLTSSAAADSLELGRASSHARQYADLLQAINGGHEPAISIADAALVLATVRALYLSASLERRVDIDEVLAGDLDSAATPLLAGAARTR